jgi:hypothetical protein
MIGKFLKPIWPEGQGLKPLIRCTSEKQEIRYDDAVTKPMRQFAFYITLVGY